MKKKCVRDVEFGSIKEILFIVCSLRYVFFSLFILDMIWIYFSFRLWVFHCNVDGAKSGEPIGIGILGNFIIMLTGQCYLSYTFNVVESVFFPSFRWRIKKKELRKIKWRRKSGCSVFQTFFSHWNAIFSFYFVLVVASAPFDICWLLEQNSISVLQLVLCLLACLLTRSLGDFSITHLLIQEFASVCVWVLDAVFRLIYTIMGQHKCIISLEFIPFCPIPFGTVPFRSVLFHSFRIL